MVKTGFNWNRECPRFLADMTGHGRCDIVGFGIDGVWVARSDGLGGFLSPERVCDGFALNKGSWRVDQHVRLVGEVKGKDLVATPRLRIGSTPYGIGVPRDLVGFGDDGVYIAFNGGPKNEPWPVQFVLPNFGVNQSWSVDRDTRILADLTGRGRDSIVGFQDEGALVVLNDGHGGFVPPQSIPSFSSFTLGRHPTEHLRFAADLSLTGRADLVGFGDDYVWVARNNGNGSFGPVEPALRNGLCFNQGWRLDRHPRFAARLTQERRADLVGFGDDDVQVALNKGDGSFGPGEPANVNDLCYNQGWRVDRHPRFVSDLRGKGQADLVGFGNDYVWVALNNGDGSFAPPKAYVNDLCYDQGWRVEDHPRFLADLTGNGLPDIVGFGNDGVWVARNDSNGGFEPAKLVLNDFGLQSLSGIDHVFVLIMENRSFDHMLGFSGITGTDAVTNEATKINGLDGKECNSLDGSLCDPTNILQQRFTVFEGAHDIMPKDPGHSFRETLTQLVAAPNYDWIPWQPYPPPNNLGFVTQYGDCSVETGPCEIMRCFGPDQPQSTDDRFTGYIPVLHALAKEFVVCDAWFSSLPGPTFPNRMFAHAASSGGLDDQPDNSDILAWELVPSAGFSFQNGTIFDALQRAGIRYRLYGTREPAFSVDAEGPFPMLAGLKGIHLSQVRDLQIDDQRPYPGRNRLVQDLPREDFTPVRYIHIEPSYGFLDNFKYGTSQHPLASVRAGDNFIKMIYEAIRNSPVWERSLLVITWDEHGGFYDHVIPPPAVPPGDIPIGDSKNGFLFDRLGVRVPAIIISPWIPKNLIDHRRYDHASIPATIEELFGLGPLTDRDRYANSVSTLLTLMAPRTDAPTTVGPSFGIEPTPRTGGPTPPRPEASINEPDAAPFLAILVAQDLQVSKSSEERAAVFRRVREIKTHSDAWVYMKEVQQKLAARRPSRTTGEVSNKSTGEA